LHAPPIVATSGLVSEVNEEARRGLFQIVLCSKSSFDKSGELGSSADLKRHGKSDHIQSLVHQIKFREHREYQRGNRVI
jgi:hypothetical protein